MQPLFKPGDIVLFQGDSITDAGRDNRDPEHLGTGYAFIAAAWFQALYPTMQVRFLNRGVGGNRVLDLAERWKKDCLDLQPTWVSILIGINDTWRRYSQNDPTAPEDFEAAYRALLQRTMASLNARLILCEPFVLPVPTDRAQWREDLDPKIALVRKLAYEFEALLVPFDGLFAQAASRRPAAFWAPDGVHPGAAGHALMAQAWLRALNAIA